MKQLPENPFGMTDLQRLELAAEAIRLAALRRKTGPVPSTKNMVRRLQENARFRGLVLPLLGVKT